MNCPKCDSDDVTLRDSRSIAGGNKRRRYHCNDCNHKHTTYEVETSIYRDIHDAKLKCLKAIEHVAEFNAALPDIRIVEKSGSKIPNGYVPLHEQMEMQ